MTVPARQNQAPSFLTCLKVAVEGAPESLTKIVDKSIEIHNFNDLLRFYEIKNPTMARAVLDAIRVAVAAKMEADVEAHEVGATTFSKVITHAVAFGIIAGAHLAKEKEL